MGHTIFESNFHVLLIKKKIWALQKLTVGNLTCLWNRHFFSRQNFPLEKTPQFKALFLLGERIKEGKKVPVRGSILVWFLPPEEISAL